MDQRGHPPQFAWRSPTLCECGTLPLDPIDAAQFLESATEEAVSQVYGENYPRLVKLKSVIDPKNVFRHAMWPRPDAPNDRRQVGEKNPEVEVDTSKADVSARTADGPSASDGIPDKGKARAVGQADIFESLTSTSDQVPPAPLSELTAAVEQAAREKRVPTGMTVPAVNASDTVM